MSARVDETPGVASRRAAADLIDGLFLKGRDFDDPQAEAALAKLTARDRAFARRLAITVARHRGTLEAFVTEFVERPPKGKAKRILPILQAGAAELLFLNAPAHAVVDSAVALAKAEGMAGMAGLTNAVLRRVARREGRVWLNSVDAARLDLPDWLWTDWTERFGEPTVRAIHKALSKGVAPLDITLPDASAVSATQLGGTRIGPSSVRLTGGTAVPDVPGYEQGNWWVQDVAATLPARLLGDVQGQSVIDLCAAPGGKTAQLIADGAQVTAVDRAASRLKRLKENLTRLKLTADQVVEADAVTWRPEAPGDAVLLDAPCSATGTLRRHPEIAHRRTAEDLAKLVTLQRKLLSAAVEMLKPGGLLVVATCSLQKAETADLHAAAIAMPTLECVPVTAADIPGIPEDALQGDGSLVTHPALLAEQGGMDGFFVGRYRKTEG